MDIAILFLFGLVLLVVFITCVISLNRYVKSWKKNGNYDNYTSYLMWGWLSLMGIFGSSIGLILFIGCVISLFLS